MESAEIVKLDKTIVGVRTDCTWRGLRLDTRLQQDIKNAYVDAKLLNSKLSKTFPEETKHCISYINLTFCRKNMGRSLLYTSMAPPPGGTKSRVRCYSTLTRSLKICFTPLSKAHLGILGRMSPK